MQNNEYDWIDYSDMYKELMEIVYALQEMDLIDIDEIAKQINREHGEAEISQE